MELPPPPAPHAPAGRRRGPPGVPPRSGRSHVAVPPRALGRRSRACDDGRRGYVAADWSPVTAADQPVTVPREGHGRGGQSVAPTITASLLFTDLVGSTDLLSRLGPET